MADVVKGNLCYHLVGLVNTVSYEESLHFIEYILWLVRHHMLIYKNVNYSFVRRVYKVDYASAGHNCFEFRYDGVLVGE